MCAYNTIDTYTDHFIIRKKGFRRKFVDFCKITINIKVSKSDTVKTCEFELTCLKEIPLFRIKMGYIKFRIPITPLIRNTDN